MKQEINPAVAIAGVVVVLAIIGFLVWRGTGGGAAPDGAKPPGMPPQVQAEWNKYTSGQKGGSVPAGAQPAGAGMPGAPAGSAIPTGPAMGPGTAGMPGAPAGSGIPTGPPLR